MEYTIDAAEKRIGRVATEAAMKLMGKNEPTYQRHKLSGNTVHIINASRADISAKKRAGKEYIRYSGYPGGLKEESMENVIKKKGYVEVFRRAVYGMLPANRLRKEMMKQLKVNE